MHNEENIAMIISLCKDIARHASQLEAECQGTEQSTDRYLELKSLLVGHYLQSENNFETILKELRKSMSKAIDLNENAEILLSVKNHMLCMFEYFLMLTNEERKN